MPKRAIGGLSEIVRTSPSACHATLTPRLLTNFAGVTRASIRTHRQAVVPLASTEQAVPIEVRGLRLEAAASGSGTRRDRRH
jgi:hypothetical protein